MSDSYNIRHIINRIESAHAGQSSQNRVCIFLGAGADLTSGGKLFRDLKISFLKFDGVPVSKSISDCKLDVLFQKSVEKLSQNGRCETLENIMRDHRAPSEGYKLMVLLADIGIIDNVVTTNFDLLLEESEEILGVHPFRVFAPGLAIPADSYQRKTQLEPTYIKLHGDLNARMVSHLSKEELENHNYDKAFTDYLSNIFKTNIIIFVGYSGYDTLVTSIIENEIDNMDECFWCNPYYPQEDSCLAKLLKKHNKFCFIKTNFDDLFITMSEFLFADQSMPNQNYIFFDAILKSKSQKLVSNYLSYYDNRHTINRKQSSDKFKQFLSDTEKKLLLIYGEPCIGKSSILKKVIFQYREDITWLPIYEKGVSSIIKRMAEAIGYGLSETPFSLLYSFSEWCNKNGKLVVFVIDDIYEDKLSTVLSTEQYNEFLTFIRATQSFSYVKYVLTFSENENTNRIEEMYRGKYENIAYISSEKVIHFNDDEIKNLLKTRDICPSMINEEIFEFLREPAIWSILDRIGFTFKDIESGSFFDALIKHISVNANSFALKQYLQECAYCQIFEEKETEIKKDKIYDILLSSKIINEDASISNNLICSYYCGKSIIEKCEGNTDTVVKTYVLPLVESSEDQRNNVKVHVLLELLSNVRNIDDIEKIIVSLEQVFKKMDDNISFLTIFTINLFEKIVKKAADLFSVYINQIDLNLLSRDVLLCLTKTITQLKPAWSNIFIENKEKEISFDAFITLNDYIYKNRNYEYAFSMHMSFLISLYQLSYWGWDNVSSSLYATICNSWRDNIVRTIMLNEVDIEYVVKNIKENAYNLFFNCGDDIDEKYISVINSPIISRLREKLLHYNDTISDIEFIELLHCDHVYTNSIFFIISNCLVLSSMRIDYKKTVSAIMSAYYKTQLNVENIDFLLSSFFWSLYLCKPYNRKDFTDFFNIVISDYETTIFDFPSHKREASIKRYKEQFEYEFEDGFNPLAFYFYTAPYDCIDKDSNAWNRGKLPLSSYWDLLYELKQSGNYGNILRIVHALGQMISIYPEEGLAALDNIKPYLSEPIIKKGVVRILKESYMRNTIETNNWLNNCNELKDDILSIKYNTQLYVNNRTFEQLHWSRLFYNIEKMYGLQLDNLLIANIEKPTFNSFLKNTIQQLGCAMECIRN